MEKKFTPGPWRIYEGPSMIVRPGIAAGEDRNIIFPGWDKDACGVFGKTHTEMRANAHLIASAPELYEALQYARRFLNPADHDTAFVDAALAKAIGQSVTP